MRQPDERGEGDRACRQDPGSRAAQQSEGRAVVVARRQPQHVPEDGRDPGVQLRDQDVDRRVERHDRERHGGERNELSAEAGMVPAQTIPASARDVHGSVRAATASRSASARSARRDGGP